jgi:hypothetical protein
MATRSGTNDLHGTIFDYFRNDALDANSWFNDNTNPPTKKTAERQNDFGGTLGGPIFIPRFYNGRNRSFFFFSFEGLRLVQPVGATINAVPSLELRQATHGALQQALNAFPLPTPNTPDLGQGLSEFVSGWSTPSQVDATSIRLDHNIGERTHLFFRFSNTPSNGQTRGTSNADSTPSALTSSTYLARSYTFGGTRHIAMNLDDDLRFIFGSSTVLSHTDGDNFGGAVPANLSGLQDIASSATTILGLTFGPYNPELSQRTYGAQQHMWNLVDTVSFIRGMHTLKAGVDWRQLSSTIQQTNPYAFYFFSSPTSLTNNAVDIGGGQSNANVYPVYKNFSAFVQDEWRVTSRLNISMGVRWEVDPAPGVSRGLMPYTFIGLDNLSTLALAPQGTPQWKTTWYNFAPRLGFAYQGGRRPGFATVLRAGGGVFFDTGQQNGSAAFSGPGFSVTKYFGTDYQIAASFPVPPALISPTITQPPQPVYSSAFANSTHMQLPYAFQWNASLEQSLGQLQSVTVSYVGSNGRRLLEESEANIAKYNPNFTYLYTFKNGLTSSYNALQVKYQRQVARGLQALVSYTWSHNLDYGSYNAALPYQRGNSDQDLRHNLTAAISYDIPRIGVSSFLRILSSNWGIDGRFTVRTGFPVTLNGNSVTDPTTGQLYFGGLNLEPNTPLFLYGSRSQYPGGRRINQAAFCLPTVCTTNILAPRNFISGFGAGEADVAFRRSFPIFKNLHGQFRAEAFNISNHPNFGSVNATFGNIQFGEATAILAQSLGTLSPLYQMGGPRSLQLALRLTY